jgi:predicted CXXCH cytochrome family protein
MLAQGPDLCFTCHKPVKDRMAAGKMHPPADDCLTCHQPHTSAEPKLVGQPVRELCWQCHDAKDAAFGTAHLGIDPQTLTCMKCHDPHASKDAKLFKSVLHPPFAARQCDACHEPLQKAGK